MLAFVITMLSLIAVDDLKIGRNYIYRPNPKSIISHIIQSKSTLKQRAGQHTSRDIAA
jgi:hypothetical protein